MSPVKLPSRAAWLCGTCAGLHASHSQAIDCCAEPGPRELTRGDRVLLAAALTCAIFFLASIFVPRGLQSLLGTC